MKVKRSGTIPAIPEEWASIINTRKNHYAIMHEIEKRVMKKMLKKEKHKPKKPPRCIQIKCKCGEEQVRAYRDKKTCEIYLECYDCLTFFKIGKVIKK